MIKLKHGLLITLEGIDGSGKSSVARELYNILFNTGFEVLLTKEPGGTMFGKQLRSILQEYQGNISDQAEFLLFAADRAQHFQEVIIPALNQQKIIISDRLADSSVVYQGYGRGLDINMITTINCWIMHNIQPQLTFYLKIDVQTALQRIMQRNETLTRFEQEKKDFFERLIKGFNEIFALKKNVITIDASQPSSAVIQQTSHYLLSCLEQHKVNV